MIAVGTLVASVLPLLAIIYLLRAARHEEQADQALIEVLVREATVRTPDVHAAEPGIACLGAGTGAGPRLSRGRWAEILANHVAAPLALARPPSEVLSRLVGRTQRHHVLFHCPIASRKEPPMLVPNYEFPAEAYVAIALVFCLLAFLVYVLGAGIVYTVREELRYRRERRDRLSITHGEKLRVFPAPGHGFREETIVKGVPC